MTILNVSTPVLVLGAARHGSLGILRSLGELGIPVYATYSGERGPAVFSRFCKRAFEWKFQDFGDSEKSVDDLVQIAKAIRRPAILIPTWDETAVFVAEHYQSLAPWYIFPQQTPELARTLVDKRQMYFLAKKYAVPTAEISFPNSIEDVRQFARLATFPVLLKGIDGNRLKKHTGKKMVIVHRPEELLRTYREFEGKCFNNLMLQEYIHGGQHPDWMFNGYFNENSDCLAGFTGKKLRQTPTYTGMTSLGVCSSNTVVKQRTTEWMKKLGYRGILDIGYRYDARDGEYKVLDVNPRIGATFRLFVGDNGLDVVRALYLDMTGQNVPACNLQEGRKWMVELDFKSCVEYYRDGNLNLKEWLSSLHRIDEFGYFRIDDLRPVAQLCFFVYRRALQSIRQHVNRFATLVGIFGKRHATALTAKAE